jgi:hypothetical protein
MTDCCMPCTVKIPDPMLINAAVLMTRARGRLMVSTILTRLSSQDLSASSILYNDETGEPARWVTRFKLFKKRNGNGTGRVMSIAAL